MCYNEFHLPHDFNIFNDGGIVSDKSGFPSGHMISISLFMNGFLFKNNKKPIFAKSFNYTTNKEINKKLIIGVTVGRSGMTWVLEILKAHKNTHSQVIIDYQSNQASAQLSLGESWKISLSDACLLALNKLCGTDKISIIPL